jgi:hypothetical protein
MGLAGPSGNKAKLGDGITDQGLLAISNKRKADNDDSDGDFANLHLPTSTWQNTSAPAQPAPSPLKTPQKKDKPKPKPKAAPTRTKPKAKVICRSKLMKEFALGQSVAQGSSTCAKLLLSKVVCLTVNPKTIQTHLDKLAKRLEAQNVSLYTEDNDIDEFDSKELLSSMRQERKRLTALLSVATCNMATQEKDAVNFDVGRFKEVVDDALEGGVNLPVDFPLCVVRRQVTKELEIIQKTLADQWAGIKIQGSLGSDHQAGVTLQFKEWALTLALGLNSATLGLEYASACGEKGNQERAAVIVQLSSEQVLLINQACKLVFGTPYECEEIEHAEMVGYKDPRVECQELFDQDELILQLQDTWQRFAASVVTGLFAALGDWAHLEDEEILSGFQVEWSH